MPAWPGSGRRVRPRLIQFSRSPPPSAELRQNDHLDGTLTPSLPRARAKPGHAIRIDSLAGRDLRLREVALLRGTASLTDIE